MSHPNPHANFKPICCTLFQTPPAQGHELASHTVNHPNLRDLSKSQIRKEIADNRKAIAKCGVPEQVGGPGGGLGAGQAAGAGWSAAPGRARRALLLALPLPPHPPALPSPCAAMQAITGFRCPFLADKPEVRQVLAEEGFR